MDYEWKCQLMWDMPFTVNVVALWFALVVLDVASILNVSLTLAWPRERLFGRSNEQYLLFRGFKPLVEMLQHWLGWGGNSDLLVCLCEYTNIHSSSSSWFMHSLWYVYRIIHTQCDWPKKISREVPIIYHEMMKMKHVWKHIMINVYRTTDGRCYPDRCGFMIKIPGKLWFHPPTSTTFALPIIAELRCSLSPHLNIFKTWYDKWHVKLAE
jgi:hypothetical protein